MDGKERQAMKTIAVNVYKFDELSDAAKERAREWFRQGESELFGAWGDQTEFAETAAKLLGITFDTHSVPLHGGGTRQESNIWYSGFSSQGDGASFTGSYDYRKGSSKAVRAEFGTDKELHRIADELTALQKKHGYKLTATITQSGHYYHKNTMDARVTRFTHNPDVDEETENELLELMRDFAQWIYDGLEEEYNYRMSDEAVDDGITANDYDFTVDGKRTTGID
jgi:hypothetical protein